ncbi:MAG: ribosome maturation factor RimM [Anaerolineae bacterium]|nr:ribosome maturation factor RimM [Anaerolineae bacterium]
MADSQSSSPPAAKKTATGAAAKPKPAVKLFEIGKITRPHGILGEVKVAIALDLGDVLSRIKTVYLDDAQHPVKIVRFREHQGAALLLLDKVVTRNDAEALRGKIVYINEKALPALPEGEYYAHDLIGLAVVTPEGVDLGKIVEVLGTGSNDVYVIHKPDSKELLLPAIDSVVKAIDFEKRSMTVIVPDGL